MERADGMYQIGCYITRYALPAASSTQERINIIYLLNDVLHWAAKARPVPHRLDPVSSALLQWLPQLLQFVRQSGEKEAQTVDQVSFLFF